MTLEEKLKEMTKRVKLRLDNVNYRIHDIHSYFTENNLLRDVSRKDEIITAFTETTLQNTLYLISDPETLEMLYVQTRPMNFVNIEEFFNPRWFINLQ